MERQKAAEPEDLSRLFVQRANARDVEGLVELYEPDAVLVLTPGHIFVGHDKIRRAYQRLLAANPTFEPGVQAAAIRNGDLALTSTRIPGAVTTEVAHRQPDGSWRWVIDSPNLLAGLPLTRG